MEVVDKRREAKKVQEKLLATAPEQKDNPVHEEDVQENLRVDKRRNTLEKKVLQDEAVASVALDRGETQSVDAEPMKVDIYPDVDPVDALISKTFTFVTSQPEWFHVLNLPRPVRKEIARKLAKTLVMFPHFSKVLDAKEKE